VIRAAKVASDGWLGKQTRQKSAYRVATATAAPAITVPIVLLTIFSTRVLLNNNRMRVASKEQDIFIAKTVLLELEWVFADALHLASRGPATRFASFDRKLKTKSDEVNSDLVLEP
jgi:hypothetical protein